MTRVHGLAGLHHQHHAARLFELGEQFGGRVGADDGLAAGAAGHKGIDLGGCAIVNGNGETVASHVEDEVFAHHG